MRNANYLMAVIILASMSAFGEAVAVDSDSSETLGMYKPPKTAGDETVLGVPFVKSPFSETNTVDTLLFAGYGNRDLIRIWNAAGVVGSEYDTWSWNQKSNAWVAVKKSTGVYPASASEYDVARGYAFWFTDRSSASNDLVQAGLVKTGAVTTVAAGTKGSPRSTLLINPYGVEIDAAEKLATGAATGDQISLVNGTVRYDYKAGFGWGLLQKGEIIAKKGDLIIYGPDKFVTTNITVAAGTAFWYISKGGSPTVQW